MTAAVEDRERSHGVDLVADEMHSVRIAKEHHLAEDVSRVTSSQGVVGIGHDDRLDAMFLRGRFVCVFQSV